MTENNNMRKKENTKDERMIWLNIGEKRKKLKKKLLNCLEDKMGSALVQ